MEKCVGKFNKQVVVINNHASSTCISRETDAIVQENPNFQILSDGVYTNDLL